jgi:hypothetical protein
MASNHAQKAKLPRAMPIIVPLDTLECTGRGEAVSVNVAVVTAMLVLLTTDRVVAAADVAFGRKSAAFAGSLDKKAGTKSACGH